MKKCYSAFILGRCQPPKGGTEWCGELMLAAPVSFAGRLEQYIGRLNRDYEGKKKIIVYDYVDSHIRVFDNMYAKRLRTYKRILRRGAKPLRGENVYPNEKVGYGEDVIIRLH